jgi:hypothetical protein
MGEGEGRENSAAGGSRRTVRLSDTRRAELESHIASLPDRSDEEDAAGQDRGLAALEGRSG